ncbi:hypothetical protein [Plesiocystis pacifica]|uniref:hypothetical protein n=1 Tax=Plesiocystis pacifica TaxID=191768 RepID=UPI0006A743A8|nr:hypothetical protein [Plesiocystis pacifica]
MRAATHLPAELTRFRSVLLAACGLSLATCTAGSPSSQTSQANPSEPETTPAEAEGGAPPVFVEEQPPPAPPVEATNCKNPTAILADGADTGYVRCEDGAINRATATACVNTVTAQACDGTQMRRDCDSHADCTDRPNGFCMADAGQMGTYCGCVYPCTDDSECAANEACLCPGVTEGFDIDFARCAPVECKTNVGCATGECGMSFYNNGCGTATTLQCRGEKDACRGDKDCGDEGGQCVAQSYTDEREPYHCAGMSCVIGRPLSLAGGQARVASIRAGASDWSSSARPTRAELPRDADLAAHWLGVARLEHASVASFARFVAELTQLGARAALIAEALRAAEDEVRHAQLAFGLASAYAGEPLGPGPLQVDDLGSAAPVELAAFIGRLIQRGLRGRDPGRGRGPRHADRGCAPPERATGDRGRRRRRGSPRGAGLADPAVDRAARERRGPRRCLRRGLRRGRGADPATRGRPRASPRRGRRRPRPTEPPGSGPRPRPDPGRRHRALPPGAALGLNARAPMPCP